MTEPIIAKFMLPITTKETVQELMQKGVDWGKTIGAIEELEKIKAEIIGSCNNIAQEVSDLSYTRKIYVYEQLSEIKGAIDNHISELKGDNK